MDKIFNTAVEVEQPRLTKAEVLARIERLIAQYPASGPGDMDVVGVGEPEPVCTQDQSAPEPAPEPPVDAYKAAIARMNDLAGSWTGPEPEYQHSLLGFNSFDSMRAGVLEHQSAGYELCGISLVGSVWNAVLRRPAGSMAKTQSRMVACSRIGDVVELLEMVGPDGWCMADIEFHNTQRWQVYLTRTDENAPTDYEHMHRTGHKVSEFLAHVLDAQALGWENVGFVYDGNDYHLFMARPRGVDTPRYVHLFHASAARSMAASRIMGMQAAGWQICGIDGSCNRWDMMFKHTADALVVGTGNSGPVRPYLHVVGGSDF